MEIKKFVGSGKILTLEDNTGFALNICISDLFEMCTTDPDVMQYIYESKKTGKKYIQLVAWPLKENTSDNFRTHSIRIDTYKKNSEIQSTQNTPKKINLFKDVSYDNDLPF